MFSIWSAMSVFFATTVSAQSLSDWSLNLIRSKKLNPDHFSFFWGYQSNQPLLNHQENQKMLPASITKLLTASAVLEHFPPGSKFKTELRSSAKQEKSTLKGNLFLVGGGDPSFVSENLWYLVNQFTRIGIKTIEGSIVVDDSLFDSVRYDDSRESVRVDRAYDAPVGAMSFNWNSVNVYVRPGEDSKAQVILDPESDYFTIVNRVKTTSGSSVQIDVDRKWDPKSQKEIFTVTGKIGKNLKEHLVFANIQKPDLWSGANLKAFLLQRGITITGGIQTGTVSSSAKVLAESESKPIEHILADMNKFSNNYVAEMLTKNMGLKKKSPGNMSSGIQVIREHLKGLGITDQQLDLINPSGLTRENRITAKSLWTVLSYHQNHFSTFPEYLSSLPIGGVDGTLKRRFKDDGLSRRVRAKTGLLNGVISLSGYVENQDKGMIPFVFMYNGPADAGLARDVIDQIIKKAYSFK
jgi:D-alanyl-D-alanine carboxypeptidase/D-alanyl-D-alanine-endopeptidase (penicillin-binding protein 4)